MKRFVQLGALGLALGGAACSSLLGIEEVHEGPAPGLDEAAGSDDSNGGAATTRGGSASAGASHAGRSSGGASNAGESNAGAPDTSDAGRAGANSDDDAGAGGAAPGAGSVLGHVIDYWNHPLVDIRVEVAGKQATTDEDGAFTVDDVPSEYDASLIVQFLDDVTQTHTYLFEGLTRRNPTLQVFRGSSDLSANLEATFSGANQSLNDDRILGFAVGSDGGRFERQFSDPSGAQTQYTWVGPVTATAHAHGLIWQNNATTDAPEAYFAYGETSFGLDSTTTDHVLFSLDLAPKSIPTGTISGTVVPANTGTARANTVSLRFGSGATIGLTNVSAPGNSFSYTVPELGDATISIAAAEGCSQSSETCSIAHRDGLTSGGVPVALTIPAPATLLSVQKASAAGDNPTFSFKPGVGSGGATVSVIDSAFGDDRLYVITNKASFTVPKVVNGSYALEPGQTYLWRVTSHGNSATVDDMTTSRGFIDSYGFYTVSLEPNGPRAGDGTYTSSTTTSFTAPN